MYKQVIIVRKDLDMSHGKMAAQVSHASMAFLSRMIRSNWHKTLINGHFIYDGDGKPARFRSESLQGLADNARENGEAVVYAKPKIPGDCAGEYEPCDPGYGYTARITLDNRTCEEWMNGAYTKVILEAKNKAALLKAKIRAEELGMKEGKDFFLIYDNCYTELKPEEENGTCLTCIGFRPMDSEDIDPVGRKYHLYIG